MGVLTAPKEMLDRRLNDRRGCTTPFWVLVASSAKRRGLAANPNAYRVTKCVLQVMGKTIGRSGDWGLETATFVKYDGELVKQNTCVRTQP